jgi:nucleoside-diphosphate-sugar epimerase
MLRVMVTGAGGYIGTQIIKDLLKVGHKVTAVDRFFFGKQTLDHLTNNENLTLLQKDIRDLDVYDLEGHEVVFDLACLSNDPAGEIDPKLTYEINRDGRISVASNAKKAGVSKYVISSSCSVYGKAEDNLLDELAITNPVSVYAKSTLEAEEQNLSIASDTFSVTALRNATVFGLSNRMRFDLVVNLMTLSAFQKGRIIVMGGGLQWRPLVHISDVSNAFIKTISCPISKVNQQIFNIGMRNIQVKNLAYLVREVLPFSVEIEIAPDDSDNRDYRVIFDKAESVLGFKGQISIEDGVREIYNSLKNGKVDVGPKTNTVKWYRNILEAKDLIDSISINGRIL